MQYRFSVIYETLGNLHSFLPVSSFVTAVEAILALFAMSKSVVITALAFFAALASSISALIVPAETVSNINLVLGIKQDWRMERKGDGI